MSIVLRQTEGFHGRVGVLTGGVSRERDRSLLSGATVRQALEDAGHSVVTIDTADSDLVDQLVNVDVAFLAIAGKYAEDGKLQGFLETLRIPYTGSGVLASAVGMNKPVVKALAATVGIPVSPHVEIDNCQSDAYWVNEIEAQLGFPVIIKPVDEGGSVAVILARTREELSRGLADRSHEDVTFVEAYIAGDMVTVGVLETSTGLHALPALRIDTEGDFYDWASKRQFELHSYECPAQLPEQVTAKLQAHARAVHAILKCRSHSRSDFIVSSDGEVCFLEVNTLPGLSREGNLGTMSGAAGLSYEHLIQHMLASAIHRPPYVP